MFHKPNKTKFLVEGMTCGHCQKRVEEALGRLSGVIKVTVDLSSKQVEVLSKKELDSELVEEVLSDLGFQAIDLS